MENELSSLSKKYSSLAIEMIIFKEDIMSEFDSLVGKSEKEVLVKLKEDNKVYRVVKRDDEEYMKTMDYDENRLNLSIEAGVVVSIIVG